MNLKINRKIVGLNPTVVKIFFFIFHFVHRYTIYYFNINRSKDGLIFGMYVVQAAQRQTSLYKLKKTDLIFSTKPSNFLIPRNSP